MFHSRERYLFIGKKIKELFALHAGNIEALLTPFLTEIYYKYNGAFNQYGLGIYNIYLNNICYSMLAPSTIIAQSNHAVKYSERSSI